MRVIQVQDPNAWVSRWPASGTAAVHFGSELVVEEGQQAVFWRDSTALDGFGPGRHTLRTENLPLLARQVGLQSPFQAAVVFVSTQTFPDLKWGTKEPIVYRDPELALVRLRAYGKFAIRILSAQTFVDRVFGTGNADSIDDVEAYFRERIVAHLGDLLGASLKTIFDLPRVAGGVFPALGAQLTEDFARSGVELVDLSLGAVAPPAEVQKAIAERSGHRAVRSGAAGTGML